MVHVHAKQVIVTLSADFPQALVLPMAMLSPSNTRRAMEKHETEGKKMPSHSMQEIITPAKFPRFDASMGKRTAIHLSAMI